MDQFRSSGGGGGGGGEAKEADSSRVSFNNPPSAFSRPILPASSTLLLPPKPLGGAPNGTSGSGSGSAPDPPADAAGRYRECLRNHAASIGGHVVDGCGEFMPAGPAEPMKCAACGCHRSFHRREPEPVSNLVRVPLLLPPPPPPPPHGPRTIGFGCSGNTTESSSEERNANHNHSRAPDSAAEMGRKTKRFRTKFSSEQKEKMTAFAERAEWRVQRKDEAEMERFCRDVGVSRQVLKVWMHNNKHHLLLKKQQQHQQPPPVDPPEQQDHQQQQQQQQRQGALAEENAASR